MAACEERAQFALIKEYEVASGQTATQGEAGILASDTTVHDAGGASDLAVCIFLESKAAGEKVRCLMLGWAIVPVLVGTGGATRGKKAKLAADGFTDASTHDSDGTGNESTYGTFLASDSTVGNLVPLLMSGAANRGV